MVSAKTKIVKLGFLLSINYLPLPKFFERFRLQTKELEGKDEENFMRLIAILIKLINSHFVCLTVKFALYTPFN